ncbi:MAG: endonuclease/exonuclease/phosphatase family protein [Gemmatimonadota bacterium]
MFSRIPTIKAAMLLLSLAACSDDPTDTTLQPSASLADPGERGITIMSRNLYLGANLDPIISAQNPNQVPFIAAQAWAAVIASNFPERAQALAAEIAATQPDLIGLQEATVYRRQSPSDFVLGNRTINANVIAYDFVALLLAALAERGLHYHVAAMVTNTDIEVPVFTGQGPLPFDDIRYTDADVILARNGIETSAAVARNYDAYVPVTIAGLPLRLLRGWTAIDAVVNGQSIRFVNTHLEVQTFRPIQEAQATQLAASLQNSPLPVVVVGDLNSAANEDAPVASRTGSYDIMRGAGYADLWLRGNGQNDGLTCCWPADVRGTTPLTQRIDFVLIRQGPSHFVGGVQMDVLGDELIDRTASGLWPSDHAGLAAVLRLTGR